MIMPTVRASVGRADALHLIELLSGGDPDLRRAAHERLEADGVDGITVHWPDGARERFPGAKADQLLGLEKGTAEVIGGR